MRSPYSDSIQSLVHEINTHFIKIFKLSTPYTREDIIPGELYGIINFRSFSTDSSKQSRNARAGFQPKILGLEILLTTGYEDWLDARAASVGLMIDLDHSLAALKPIIEHPSWIYDFEINGDISQSVRQATATPHYWLVDISCEATAKMQLYRDEQGLHIEYPQNNYQT